MLDWVSDAGGFYAVSVPGLPGEEDLIGYVLASEVEFVRDSPFSPDADRPPPPGDKPATIPELEEQYEKERQRRSSGAGKIVWGSVLVGGAYAALKFLPWVQVDDREDYPSDGAYQDALDIRNHAENGRSAVVGIGAALAAWGLGQYIFGWRRMRELELELPRSAAPTIEEQYADAAASRSSGRKKLFWGLCLAAVVYGTVEWVPYLSDPVADDFDDAADYRAAQDRREKALTARKWTTVLGTGLGVWGTTQWTLAARKMAEIERTARMSALSVPLRTSPGATIAPALFVSRVGTHTGFGVRMDLPVPGVLP